MAAHNSWIGIHRRYVQFTTEPGDIEGHWLKQVIDLVVILGYSSVQVLLQFAIDDTAGGENEDALTEIGFYVPKEAAGFQDGQEQPAKVRRNSAYVMQDHYEAMHRCRSLPSERGSYFLYMQPNGRADVSDEQCIQALIGFCHLQVLYDIILPHTDSGAAVGDAIASFGAVAVLAPRGRFEIELYGSFMKLLGQVRQKPGLPSSPLPILVKWTATQCIQCH